ncbi:MAG TPA: hypothetical protein VF737_12835 [Gemmatimonadaceae bacterium]
MFIELVDVLRCPRDHEDSWLVLGADRIVERHVTSGVLGCPVCRAQYRIENGVADLRLRPGGAPRHRAPAAEPGDPAAVEEAMRLAAFLNLTDGGGLAVLVGGWTRHANGVGALTDAPLLLVNPVAQAEIGHGASGLLADDVLPLAPASVRGIALDAGAGAAFVVRAVRAVRPRGRVLAPASVPVPEGVTELARDAAVWVAERNADAGPLIGLARAGR